MTVFDVAFLDQLKTNPDKLIGHVVEPHAITIKYFTSSDREKVELEYDIVGCGKIPYLRPKQAVLW